LPVDVRWAGVTLRKGLAMIIRTFSAALLGAVILSAPATASNGGASDPVTLSQHSVRIDLGHWNKAQSHAFMVLNVPRDYTTTGWEPQRGGYSIGMDGGLQGPPQSGKAADPAGMGWTVSNFAYDSESSPEAQAQKSLSCCPDWTARFNEKLSVPHTINGTQVGTIDAWAVERQQDHALGPPESGADAIAELYFELAGSETNTYYQVIYDASEPFYTGLVVLSPPVFVNGVPAELWNATAALNGVKGVVIDGNLPPAHVSAAVHAQTQTVSGRVSDAYGGPLVGVTVQLLSGKHVVARRQTSAHGTYSLSLRTATAGRYSVAVQLNGTTVVHPIQLHG
jgi:Carboxypeptidase regulatory-like domain